MINDHNCSQICVEVEGSFNCSCYTGYELQADRVTCTGMYNVRMASDFQLAFLGEKLTVYICSNFQAMTFSQIS